jgi:hypothetical protein
MGPLKTRVEDIKTSLSFVFKEMCNFRLIEGNLDENFMCALHPGASHSIDECDGFKKTLQDLMDRHVVQVGRRKNDEEVSAADNLALKPLVVHYTKNGITLPLDGLRPITIQVPSAFPYKDNKAVTWRYDVHICVEDLKEDQSGGPIELSDVTNIVGFGGMTRSCHIYTPEKISHSSQREMVKAYGDKRKGKTDIINQEVDTEETAEESEKGVPICDLSQSFRSAGFEFPGSISAIVEEYSHEVEHDDLVRTCPPNMELNNWKIIEFPVIFMSGLK